VTIRAEIEDRPEGTFSSAGRRASKRSSRNRSRRPRISPWERGQRLIRSALPTSDSEILKVAQTLAEPVRRNIPAAPGFVRRSRSTRLLIASRIAGAFWNSSMKRGRSLCSMKPAGSAFAAALGPASSKLTQRADRSAATCRARVLFPHCRGPVIATTGVSANAASTPGFALR